ncbi:alpha/beta hydrolase [Myroides albus]|uniref:Alpha/beta hydrolase n=1 Tax=Myroides albus TaxID=2562892 RepID=A0A6I3LK73_9FLAO|nr:alpha/beta hydrolase [Myroides albus]MTG97976.1 alpha/beta hydrolase [Myroides albus]UVD80267.1 alpha/beta hydrolase [Myroides albus]
MNKIPIFFFPGMTSNSLIFERINIDLDLYEPFYFEWLPIVEEQSLSEYCDRYIELMPQPNPVLIGVSFGGIIAQEISKKIEVRKTIIISSVRSNKEFPNLYRFARKTKLYKLLPTGKVNFFLKVYQFFLSKKHKERMIMYDKYLPLRSKGYLDWCIDKILNWNQESNLENVIHIHGEKDELFPIKNIENAIVLKGGTHAMILTKYKWFNSHLSNIIQEVKK